MIRVALLQAHSYEQGLKEKLNELLALIGGLESIVRPGTRVLLKPNFVVSRPPESATTTHPDFIVAMCELLLDYGCGVAIGESPGIEKATEVARKIGLTAKLQRFRIPVVNFERTVTIDEGGYGELPFERRFRRLRLAGELGEFEHIINLPKLKSHGQMGVTLATKNLFGCIVGAQKGQWHYAAGKDLKAFARLLIEVALTVGADLHVMDGILGMDGNGPSNGRARPMNVILAGSNPLAVDRVVLEIIGKKPSQIPVFEAASEVGLNGVSLKDIEVVGDRLQECRIEDFQTPSLVDVGGLGGPFVRRLLGRFLGQKMALDPGKCVGCRVCEKHCPAEAISYGGTIVIDETKCIKCCCCQEMCPVGALSVSEPIGLRILRFIRRG